jgi:hypothetical protein
MPGTKPGMTGEKHCLLHRHAEPRCYGRDRPGNND